jgi:hypothetical protein
MSPLDIDGRQRLATLRERGSAPRFQEVGPVTGSDPETGLALTLDAARRVLAAHVPDAGLLRTSGLLRAAVRVAFQDADLARSRASRELTGGEPPRTAADEIDVATLLRPERTAPRGVARRTRAAVAGGSDDDARSTTPSLSATGRSANGFLLVRVGPTGVVEDVEADTAWLAGAREQFLEAALVQAFQEAALTKVGDPR